MYDMSMPQLQESEFGEDHDYLIGSPHLKHRHLKERLLSLVRQSLKDVEERELPLEVLEVGAGHGGYTEPLLAYGCKVTATETSRPSVERLRSDFRLNRHFTAIFSNDGSLRHLNDRQFSVVLCSSVLHHVPDYLALIDEACTKHLLPGGAFVSLQDPLWYPTLSRGTHYLSKVSYFTWRLGHGDYIRGAKTRLRRLRGTYDERNPADMVEYHVVRDGVNEFEILSLIRPKFERVGVTAYWSAVSSLWQRVGDAIGQCNTFAIQAYGYRGE